MKVPIDLIVSNLRIIINLASTRKFCKSKIVFKLIAELRKNRIISVFSAAFFRFVSSRFTLDISLFSFASTKRISSNV